MTRRNFAHCCAGFLLAAATLSAARAAEDAFCEPLCEHDMQLFAPVDFDFDCLPIREECGFFFNYNRVSWHVSGAHAPIGSPGLAVLSEDIWPADLAEDPLQPAPQRYVVENGITNATPGKFGWGDRYEFGYFRGQDGWMMGIIDDQRLNTGQAFGGGPQTSGFGSIHVNFELANPDLLVGFRDYGGVIVGGEEIPTPTQGGPGVGGNGQPDDLDGDLADGTGFIFIDANGNGIFDVGTDPIVGIFADYGDGYEFNTTFNAVNIRTSTRTDGVELMKTYVLDNSHWFVNHQRGQLQVGAGVRFMRIKDEFGFNGTSDILTGRNIVATEVENQIVGPQLFLRYAAQRNRLRLGIDGRFVFGYNIQDLEQEGVVGENLLPGGVNQPFLLQPTGFAYARQDNDFSPMAELRADLAYQLTGNIALKLGYTAIFVDNVSRAASVTRWRLPDMGFNPAGQQEIFMNGADFGVEVVY